MANEIITTLHPNQDPDTNLYPNIKKECIPQGAVSRGKLDNDVNSLLNNIGSMSPKGTFSTLEALETAFPSGTDGVYLVSGNGNWYYWNGSAWTNGGVYLSSVDTDQMQNADFILSKSLAGFVFGENLFDPDNVVSGQMYRPDMHTYQTGWTSYGTIEIALESGKTYKISGYTQEMYQNAGYRLQNALGQSTGEANITGDFIITTSATTVLIKLTIKLVDINRMIVCELNPVNDLATRLSNVETKENDLEDYVFDNLFGKNLFTDGGGTINENKAYRATPTGTVENSNNKNILELKVISEGKYRITGFHDSLNPFGYYINNASGSRIGYGIITGDFDLVVPEGGTKLGLTYFRVDEDEMSILYLGIIKDIEKDVEELNELKPFVHNLSEKRITLKDFGQTINGYDYFAFGGGIAYKGMQVFALRVAYEHMPRASYSAGYGKIYIYYSIDGQTFNTHVLDIDYSSYAGEFRDINLSKTRDGEHLLLTAAAVGQSVDTKSYMFVLNEDFEVQKTIKVGNDGVFAWGNTLQTSDGYLLKTGYLTISSNPLQNQAIVLKSNQTVSTGFDGMTFSEVHRFISPQVINEGCLTYVKNKLVFISRADSYNGVVYETSDLSGETGWSNPYTFGMDIKSPALLPFYDKDVIEFFATYPVSGSSPEIRYPIMLYYDTVNHTIVHQSFVDDTLTGAGGYPAFVKLGDNDYRVMYYDDYNNSDTALYYKKFNPYLDGNIEYFK